MVRCTPTVGGMNRDTARIGWLVAIIVVIGAVTVLAGGLLAWLHPAALLPSGTGVTTGVRLYGARMAARSLPLGVALVLLLATRSRRLLGWTLVLVAATEIGDCVSALAYQDWAELVGGAVVTIAFGWAAGRLLRGSVRAPR